MKNQETLKDIQQQIQSQHAQNTEKYQDLRQDILDDRKHSINGWASTFLFVFSVVSVFMYIENKELQQKAEISLGNIKKYEKDAKHGLETIQALPRNPKQKLTKEAKQGVEKYGTKLQKLMLVARQQKDYKKAIALWQDIITIADYEDDKKSLVGGYFNLGYSYNELKEYQKAINAYKKVIKIEPGDYEAHNNMGDVYLKLKEYQEAIGAYKEVIKFTSGAPVFIYRKLVDIKPDDREVIFADSNQFIGIGIADYAADDTFKAYYNMGIAYRKLKKYQKAIDAYQKAIDIKSDYYMAYNNMGVVYNILEKDQKAIDAFEKAIKIKPDFYKAKRNLNSTLKQSKEQ